MSWWQLTVQTTREELEQTEQVLLSLGALSLTLDDAQDDPIYEPPIGTTPVWPSTSLTGLFEQTRTIEDLYDELVEKLPAHQISSIRKHLLEDQVWERAFLEDYKPVLFGRDLWICPSWIKPPQADACNIILDPGIAFGTGTHPTTALCLEYLDANPPAGKSVLDFGCGSGILGIAACKLGARHVSFVDIDPQALQATLENTRTNAIQAKQIQIIPANTMPEQPVDYLLANILSGPLIGLKDKLASLTLPGAQLVLSGILPAQAQKVVDAYQADFELDAISQKDGWCRITGLRKD